MKTVISNVLLIVVALHLMSATHTATVPDITPATVAIPKKESFLHRLLHFSFLKKGEKQPDVEKANGLAGTSLALGIVSCVAIVGVVVSPLLFLASIPLGIAAMITGGAALRQKTTKVGEAKTGKALGLGALIAFGVLILAAAILISSIEWD